MSEEFWEEGWMFRHPGFRCFFGSHDPELTARWTENRDRDGLQELWTWWYCTRCRRILSGRDSGKRWIRRVPK